MDSIGMKIKYFRNMRNFTRRDLVEGICDESTLFRIEKGDNIPSLFIIDELCKKMNIPLSMLFEEQSQNNDKSSILFLKQRCRNLVYTNNYASLSFLLDELSDGINKNREVIKEDKLFLIWHKAIVIHRLKSEPEKAKELLIKHIPQKAILETELSMLNSLGLICKSH